MELPSCALVLAILGVCLREIDGNIVTLTPRPFATVTEGESLKLQCDYNGSYTLITVNWFLNGNSFGLEIDASVCSYLSTPPGYEVSRYNKTCNNPSFSLLITNVTKDKDGNNTWGCDTTPIGTTPPTRLSTTVIVYEKTVTTTTTSTSNTATTITMTTTTIAILTTNTEMGTTKNIMATSSCPLPVLVIIGIGVSGFLFILLVFIICCCCQCCCLYHYRKKQSTDKYEAEFVEAYDNENDNNHTKAKDGTPNPAYVLSNAPSKSSTSDKFKDALPNDGTLNALIQSSTHTANQTSTCTSNQDWKDKPLPNKNEVKESKHGKQETTNL